MTDLKLCPFCGRVPRVVQKLENGMNMYKVQCHDCGASAQPFQTRNVAIDDWNERTEVTRKHLQNFHKELAGGIDNA